MLRVNIVGVGMSYVMHVVAQPVRCSLATLYFNIYVVAVDMRVMVPRCHTHSRVSESVVTLRTRRET